MKRIEIECAKSRIWHALEEAGGELRFSELYRVCKGACGGYFNEALKAMEAKGEISLRGDYVEL